MRDLTLAPEEVLIFDLYLAGVVAMARCHPGAGFNKHTEVYDPAIIPSQEECVNEVLDMIELRRKVLANPVDS